MTNDKISELLLALAEAKDAYVNAVSAEKLASDAAGAAYSAHILAEDAYETADDADIAACEVTNAAEAVYDAALYALAESRSTKTEADQDKAVDAYGKAPAGYFESKIVEVTSE